MFSKKKQDKERAPHRESASAENGLSEEHRRRLRDLEIRHAAGERAMAEAPEFLKKQPDVHARNLEQHERDASTYRYDFQRFGDYLTILIERPENKFDDEKKFASTISLKMAHLITCGNGAKPHCDGVIKLLSCQLERLDGDMNVGYWMVDNHIPEGFVLKPLWPVQDIWDSRPVSRTTAQQTDPQYMQRQYFERSGRKAPVDLSGVAEQAVDGSIKIEPLGLTLFYPAGRSKEMLDAMLDEIRRGYEQGPIKIEITGEQNG